MTRTKCLGVFLASLLLGVCISFGANTIMQAGEGLSLCSSKRKVIDVDRQRVVFPHKLHQQMVLAIAGGDKENACMMCHHKKRKGRDPRACRRCHAGKRQKAKGASLCLSGCHVKANRNDLVEIIKDLPSKSTRKGQAIKLKDAFHISCKNCHVVFRALNLDLDATKYLAPVEYCEGCHIAKNEEDRKAVEAEREAERKRTGNTIEAVKEFVKQSGAN